MDGIFSLLESKVSLSHLPIFVDLHKQCAHQAKARSFVRKYRHLSWLLDPSAAVFRLRRSHSSRITMMETSQECDRLDSSGREVRFSAKLDWCSPLGFTRDKLVYPLMRPVAVVIKGVFFDDTRQMTTVQNYEMIQTFHLQTAH
jgi:hypothetical protein